MKDVLSTLERWAADGRRFALATVVERRGSAPRDPGASLALSDRGEIAGSVTGGCVEPAVIAEAEEVLADAPPRLRTYGIADEDAFQVGLACGGTVAIAVYPAAAELVRPLAEAVRRDLPVARVLTIGGASIGEQWLVHPEDGNPEDADIRALLAVGEGGIVERDGDLLFVEPFTPRPAMYVLGAIDHAAALVRVGRFLGYRVTVCDARARFVTEERFPDADELVVEWPDRFLREAPVDQRTAICVLTHDHKFDVPALVAALQTPALYIGAMGSKKTTADRDERLRAAGVGDADLARIRAPIGLAIGARSPEEVAVAIAAQIVEAQAVLRTRAASTLQAATVLA